MKYKKYLKSKFAFNNSYIYDVLKYPIITEKSTKISKNNKFIFSVSKHYNKFQIKFVIEKIFNVEVLKINTLNKIGKVKRFKNFLGFQSNFKKAYVTLKKGNTIDTGVNI